MLAPKPVKIDYPNTTIHAMTASKYVQNRKAEPGGCPRIESLLRKSGFWPFFPIKFVQYNKYSPHLIEKMDSKPLSLATASILGQPPRKLKQ